MGAGVAGLQAIAKLTWLANASNRVTFTMLAARPHVPIARTSRSSLKGSRSSTEPPPRATTITST